ncbi:MAG TPA: P-loop NTPase, partial [Acidimicrobiales bacterium]|nr:P-loop NTPase [Acidimicrobiales bacterium]
GIDYFVIDTPPGTGDIPMTLARLLPQTGQLLVTTPAASAQVVAARAGDFARQSNIRVLGVIENMSGLLCECGRRHSIFGEGGGRRLADQLGVPLLASLALDPAVSAAGDTGRPVALSEPEDGPFRALAARIVTEIAPPPGAQGCSARLLDALSAAVQSA